MKGFGNFLLFILIPVLSFSQTRREWIEFGDEAFENKDYASAVYYYGKVMNIREGEDKDFTFPYDVKAPFAKGVKDSLKNEVKDTTSKNIVRDIRSQYVTHQLAESFRRNYDYQNAEIWYAKSSALPSNQFPDDLYYYGLTLISNGKYEQALSVLDKYMTLNKDQKSLMLERARKAAGGCYFALDSNNIKEDLIVSVLDSTVNKGTSAFGASWFGNSETILFTGAREESFVSDPETQNSLFLCDLFTAKRSGNKWGEISALGQRFNTAMHEGAGMVSFGSTHLYFTRWNPENPSECAIYVSRFLNETWLEPEKLNQNVNIPGSRSMHPNVLPDGTGMYFTSDRPGGQGNLDIWYVPLDDEGTPGEANNLGEVINTKDDEVTPFYHFITNTLFFSSNGHVSLGGLDVVKSSFNSDDNTWTVPRNLGRPVNSGRDESYYILDRIQQHGFFTSDRDYCAGCSGGHCPKIYAFNNEPLVFSIRGKVMNQETNEPIGNSLLTFKDIRGNNESLYLITDSLGAYFSSLSISQEWYIKAQKNKFFGDAATVSTVGLTESKEIVQDFYLNPIPQGEIEIPGIEYDLNSANLRPNSKKILDELSEFLTLNNNLTVEIASHTDSRGSDSYNLRLSEARAKSCVDYLIEKGIAADRLIPVGYGENKLLKTDEMIAAIEGKEAKEAAHQKNRRTTFRTTSEADIPTR